MSLVLITNTVHDDSAYSQCVIIAYFKLLVFIKAVLESVLLRRRVAFSCRDLVNTVLRRQPCTCVDYRAPLHLRRYVPEFLQPGRTV